MFQAIADYAQMSIEADLNAKRSSEEKRDILAMFAIKEIILPRYYGKGWAFQDIEDIAKEGYRFADAMMAARKNGHM